MLSWTLIIVIIALVMLAVFWQSNLGVRERANHAAQDACGRAGLQFLDGTVAFAKAQLARNEAGRITLRRTYVFDYTAGSIERRQGFVVMLGKRLEHIGFARDDAAPADGRLDHAPNGSHPHSSDGNVLQLEEWRRRRAQRASQSPTEPSTPPSGPPAGSAHNRDQDNGW